jgi:hypothetical protein
MDLLLGVADGDPVSHLIEDADRSQSGKRNPHRCASKAALLPAARLHRRKKVPVQATDTRFAMVHKETVDTTKSIIMQVLHDGHTAESGGVVHGRRKPWKDVVDEPDIELSIRLEPPKLLKRVPIPDCFERSLQLIDPATPKQFASGAVEVIHLVEPPKRLTDLIDGSLLTAKLQVAVEQL